jgi:hypothetical protein
MTLIAHNEIAGNETYLFLFPSFFLSHNRRTEIGKISKANNQKSTLEMEMAALERNFDKNIIAAIFNLILYRILTLLSPNCPAYKDHPSLSYMSLWYTKIQKRQLNAPKSIGPYPASFCPFLGINVLRAVSINSVNCSSYFTMCSVNKASLENKSTVVDEDVDAEVMEAATFRAFSSSRSCRRKSC